MKHPIAAKKVVKHPLDTRTFTQLPGRSDHLRVAVAPASVIRSAEGLPMTQRLFVPAAGYISEPTGQLLERPGGLPYTAVLVCASGRGWLRLDGVVHSVEAPAAAVIPAHIPHAHDPRRPGWTVWWALVGGSDVPGLVAALGTSLSSPVLGIRSTDRATSLIDEILTGYERHPSMAQVVEASGIAWRLLTFLAVDRLRPGPRDPIEQVMRYVAANVDSPLDVTELAAQVGLSVSRLLARFRTATGGGVIAYQIQLRMARAAQLLDTSDATVRQIARAVGYDDPYYFSRRFHRTHGMSPRAFRARPRP